jgi:hypothetical protein
MSDEDYIKSLENDNERLRKKVEELSTELSSYKGYNLEHLKYSSSSSKQKDIIENEAIRDAVFRDYLNKNKNK